ncbi:hypothetical protein RB653_010539 [Dictyostelium firmibasis]|uniref:Casein kinase substrate phosphoprotein PP28 domain-containing protein n=1 Tax=Dictyostelium firmibasis TaxID=79012 RepID=A0AAN7TK81_9MYCE
MAGGKRGGKVAPTKTFGREYEKNKGKITRDRIYDEEDIIKRNQSSSEESGSESGSESDKEIKNKSKLGSDSSDDEPVVVSRNPNAKKPASKRPPAKKQESDNDDSDEEESSEDEIANPNRMKQVTKKLSEINVNAKVELSRREKEELAKQAAIQRQNEKQQKSDLERLQVIRKQREEAAKRKEEEKKANEEKMAERRRLGLA